MIAIQPAIFDQDFRKRPIRDAAATLSVQRIRDSRNILNCKWL